MDFGGFYACVSHQLDFLGCLCHYLRSEVGVENLEVANEISLLNT